MEARDGVKIEKKELKRRKLQSLVNSLKFDRSYEDFLVLSELEEAISLEKLKILNCFSSQLPQELIVEIVQFLPLSEYCRVSQLNKRWCSIVFSELALRLHCQMAYPSLKKYQIKISPSWKEFLLAKVRSRSCGFKPVKDVSFTFDGDKVNLLLETLVLEEHKETESVDLYMSNNTATLIVRGRFLSFSSEWIHFELSSRIDYQGGLSLLQSNNGRCAKKGKMAGGKSRKRIAVQSNFRLVFYYRRKDSTCEEEQNEENNHEVICECTEFVKKVLSYWVDGDNTRNEELGRFMDSWIQAIIGKEEEEEENKQSETISYYDLTKFIAYQIIGQTNLFFVEDLQKRVLVHSVNRHGESYSEAVERDWMRLN